MTTDARDLATDAHLIAKSDLVLENFSARGMKAIGIDYERLREINPRIIYCSMAGFGHRGPYKNYVAYGPMQESQAGIVNLTGWPDGQPSRVGTSYPDAAGGVSAAFRLLARFVTPGVQVRDSGSIWGRLSHQSRLPIPP